MGRTDGQTDRQDVTCNVAS